MEVKSMPKKASIATTDEILKNLTEIMRSDPDDGVKINERISAAEKLFKMLRETKAEKDEERISGIVILPEIRER